MGYKPSMRARNTSQLEFGGGGFCKPGSEFGGSLLKGNAKGRRPLATKLPIHLTLRCEKSVLRLNKTFGRVEQIVTDTVRKYGVTVYKRANVGNHLHLLIKLSNLRLWAPFIRELAGRIAQAVRDVVVIGDKFWMFKPHTRIVAGWKSAFRKVLDYVELNQLEGAGIISRRKIKTVKQWRQLMSEPTAWYTCPFLSKMPWSLSKTNARPNGLASYPYVPLELYPRA